MHRAVVFALVTFAPWPASPASAQGSAPPKSAAADPNSPKARARELFIDGLKHFQNRKFRQAIHSFEMAQDIVPTADIWFNIGRAHEELAQYRRAARAYRRYLRDRVNAPDRNRVEEKVKALDKLAERARRAKRIRPKTGSLKINARLRADDELRVNGQQLSSQVASAPVVLAEGDHEVMLERDGHIPVRVRTQVNRGVQTQVVGSFAPSTRYRAKRGSPLFTWIAGATTLGLLGTSGYFAFRSAQEDGDGNLEKSRDMSSRSDIFLGAAIGGAVLTAILYFIETRAVSSERVPSPSAGPVGTRGSI